VVPKLVIWLQEAAIKNDKTQTPQTPNGRIRRRGQLTTEEAQAIARTRAAALMRKQRGHWAHALVLSAGWWHRGAS